MPYNSDLTVADVDRLLQYLEYFQDPYTVFYHEVNGYMCESQEIGSFRKAIDDTGFLLVFNWSEWLAENEVYRNLDNNIESNIMNADLETLRKLMTSYLRGDRFSEGLFISVCMKGHAAKILLRLRELKNS
ncbi:DUF6508 domain-containing protein [Paenibacillus sp. DMB20]|uniref:DUF6508 domain-containing protein n=1 Tax=Paenibacillus sp. DMB20 TaxID=1642570 RepID=UPI000627F234|nr:DUF6508 domain-containing protein [Paenibacillus sp. DMB20]KKO51720.1 hypothetical protein XI25_23515 [Paenibacillus sp. DMB20]